MHMVASLYITTVCVCISLTLVVSS